MKNPAFAFDLDALLHPAQAFRHPSEVIADPDLTLNEKRAILASWASDACAVEAAPVLRHAPGTERPVPVEDILDCLRALDKAAQALAENAAASRRLVRRRGIEKFRARRTSGRGGTGFGAAH
jgi:hypothetical protein